MPSPLQSLTLLLRELVPESIAGSQVIPFQKEIPAAYQDELERNITFNSKVEEVIMAFPAGCHQLVDVRLLYRPQRGGVVPIVPTLDDQYIALDDYTAVFHPRILIGAPGRLRVEWLNYDSLNPHSVVVIATVSPTKLEVA